MNLTRYFKRRRRSQELKWEIQHHLDLEYDINRGLGMPPEEAMRRARLKFGSQQKVHEAVWRHNSILWMEKLARDIRYGCRTLRRSPGYTLMAVLTLGLGIGANTALFTVINGVLLRPLPYRAPEQIVHLEQMASRIGPDPIGFSVQEVEDYREQSRSFSDVAEYHSMTFTLLGAKAPERVVTGVISANYFNILGAKPALGRLFTAEDEKLSAPPVLVLSHEYWAKELNADPKVIGRPFVMNDRVHTVVGVLPPLPDYPDANDVYMPTTSCPFRSSAGMIANRDARVLSVFARLRPGATAEEAQNDLSMITRRLALAYPKSYPAGAGLAVHVVPLQQELTHSARSTFLVLLGAAGLVLLLACANLANLALSRQLRRARETAIRIASGATTWDIFRQYLTESMMIAIAGGLLGLAIASAGLKLLVAYAARMTPLSGEIRLDGGVLLFAFVLSLATGVLFGAVPGFAASRSRLASLAGSADRAAGSESGTRTRNLLVIAQVAFSFVLLAGAGLMLRSLYNLLSVDTGFKTTNVLSMNINLNWTKYGELTQQNAFFGQILERAGQIPGVRAAAMSSVVPLNSEKGGMNNGVLFEGHPPRPGEPLPQVTHQLITPDYFSLLGVPLLSGRAFTDADTIDSAPVAIINAQMAKHYWPKENPVGRRLSANNGRTWVTIVGVVSNAHQFGLDQDYEDDVYFPQAQLTFMGDPKLLLRTREDPRQIVNQMVSVIHKIDPQQPVTEIRTLEELRSAQVGTPRVTATLLGIFAGLALFITVVGVTGTLGLAVSRRTKEIGIRMALGATRRQILLNILASGMTPVFLGVAAGAIAAIFCTGLLSSMLFAIRPNDPVTLMGIAGLLCLMALVGCMVPGRRAVRIDPNHALRTD